MTAVLTPCPELLYWDYVNERHSIYLRRAAGQPKPWTQDPILQTYKFTNVFRSLDTGTMWLNDNFLTPHRDDDPALVAFACCWYRMFNWWETGALLGWQTDWDTVAIKETLGAARDLGQKIFTGAHMVRSPFGSPKMEAIVNVCRELYEQRYDIIQPQTLQGVFDELVKVGYVGPFMAHEMVQDMVSTRLLENAADINTWSNAGPGAMRGLERLGLAFHPPSKAVESMLYLLERSKTEWKHERPFTLHCVEFALCEVDKYCRVYYGEGRPRSLYPGAA